MVEYVGPDGPVALRGTVTMEDPSDPEVLRIDAPREIEGAFQKRKNFRLTGTYPVVVFHGRNALPVHAHTVDVSGGGFQFSAPQRSRWATGSDSSSISIPAGS